MHSNCISPKSSEVAGFACHMTWMGKISTATWCEVVWICPLFSAVDTVQFGYFI